MVALAQLVNMQILVVTVRCAHNGINRKAENHSDENLQSDDSEQNIRRYLLGYEYGQHLVGCREKHGEQRAERDDACGIKR